MFQTLRSLAKDIRRDWHARRSDKVDLKLPLRVFGTDYGGWGVDLRPLNSRSVIYSFGVGEDISFDLKLAKHTKARIHLFDPTPRSINFVEKQNLSNQFQFHPYGISHKDGSITLYAPQDPTWVSHSVIAEGHAADRKIEAPVKTLSTIMKELGHKQIDLLKLDIEGSEYTVVRDFIGAGIFPEQVLIEFHHRFPGVGKEKTQGIIESLMQNQYRSFWISDSEEEYSFTRRAGISRT